MLFFQEKNLPIDNPIGRSGISEKKVKDFGDFLFFYIYNRYKNALLNNSSAYKIKKRILKKKFIIFLSVLIALTLD